MIVCNKFELLNNQLLVTAYEKTKQESFVPNFLEEHNALFIYLIFW